MNIFDFLITNPLMFLIKFYYGIFHSYIVAIILFSISIKVILFPLSLWAQSQSAKLAKIKPQLDDIKAYLSHDLKTMLKEQKKLYKKEKYNSFASMVPLLLQIPIIIAVSRGLDASGILAARPENIILPLVSAVSAFLLCYAQNVTNVLAKEMTFFAKWNLAIFLTIFSFYFTYVSGIGFAIYWIAGNLLGIAVQFICNAILKPQKYITYELLPPPKKDRVLLRRQRKQQSLDMKKFKKAKKNLVFYSEASGFYKYYKGMIEYILNNSKIKVHYLTSDINDQVFKIEHPNFIPYYCGPKKLITVLMELDCKVAVFTMPDLQKYQYKRSIVNKNIQYIYVHHGFNSLTLTIKKNSLDYFDTIFCFGKHYNDEIRAMEAYYGSKEKKLVNTGYDLYYQLRNKYVPQKNDKETVIIAPSWQRDNILETCIDDIMKELDSSKYKIIIRPHPEFIKRFPKKVEILKKKFGDSLQLDFATDILNADIIISDWSSVAWEFSYTTNKPALFINTPMKIMNPDWDKYGLTPLEISIKDKIGKTIELNEICKINEAIEEIKKIENPQEIISSLMYDNEKASEISGQYIIEEIKNAVRKQQDKN